MPTLSVHLSPTIKSLVCELLNARIGLRALLFVIQDSGRLRLPNVFYNRLLCVVALVAVGQAFLDQICPLRVYL